MGHLVVTAAAENINVNMNKDGFYKAFNNIFGKNWTQCFRGFSLH